eukprot:7956450-Pyramimonas_sp.AAC.1
MKWSRASSGENGSDSFKEKPCNQTPNSRNERYILPVSCCAMACPTSWHTDSMGAALHRRS